jgi:hypothetical protein
VKLLTVKNKKNIVQVTICGDIGRHPNPQTFKNVKKARSDMPFWLSMTTSAKKNYGVRPTPNDKNKHLKQYEKSKKKINIDTICLLRFF